MILRSSDCVIEKKNHADHLGHSTITVQTLSPGIKGAIYDIYQNFEVFFFYNEKSVSQKHLCVTPGINSSQVTWKKNILFSDTAQAKVLVPCARFFPLTQHYVNNAQTRTKVTNAFQ